MVASPRPSPSQSHHGQPLRLHTLVEKPVGDVILRRGMKSTLCLCDSHPNGSAKAAIQMIIKDTPISGYRVGNQRRLLSLLVLILLVPSSTASWVQSGSLSTLPSNLLIDTGRREKPSSPTTLLDSPKESPEERQITNHGVYPNQGSLNATWRLRGG